MKALPINGASTLRRARSAPAYTLAELIVAMSVSVIILTAGLAGVIALQKSYAATETYASGLSDQMRLLDSLALDLRRATAVPVMDADGQGLQITVPSYYRFAADDPQHRFPIPNLATIDLVASKASYQDPANPGVTTQTIAYRFSNGSVTRSDPWQPLVLDPVTGGYSKAPPQVIASNMAAFPTITPDAGTLGTAVLHYNVKFYSTYQFLATPNASNTITLHNVTFVRSENLAH